MLSVENAQKFLSGFTVFSKLEVLLFYKTILPPSVYFFCIIQTDVLNIFLTKYICWSIIHDIITNAFSTNCRQNFDKLKLKWAVIEIMRKDFEV